MSFVISRPAGATRPIVESGCLIARDASLAAYDALLFALNARVIFLSVPRSPPHPIHPTD
jgi:hypothetical protein